MTAARGGDPWLGALDQSARVARLPDVSHYITSARSATRSSPTTAHTHKLRQATTVPASALLSSLPAQHYVDRRRRHRDPGAHHGGARRRHPGRDRRRRPQARQGGQEALRPQEAARHPRPPDLPRDGDGGHHDAEGAHGLEPGGHRQVHRGQALGAPPGQLPQDPPRPAQEARRLGQAHQGQELLQARRQGPRRRQAQEGQGARQEEAGCQEARRQDQGARQEEACRQEARRQGARQEGRAQGQGPRQDQGRREAQGCRCQEGRAQGQGSGEDQGRRQAQGPSRQGGQDLRHRHAREEGACRCRRTQEARRQEAAHQADRAGEEGSRRRQEGARPEGRQEVGQRSRSFRARFPLAGFLVLCCC